MLKNVFRVWSLAKSTSINFVEKKQETYETHVDYQAQNYFNPEIVVNDDGGQSQRGEEHDDKPDDNSIKHNCHIIFSYHNQKEVYDPIPHDHVAIHHKEHKSKRLLRNLVLNQNERVNQRNHD